MKGLIKIKLNKGKKLAWFKMYLLEILMKIIILTLLSFNLFALKLNTLNIELKFKIKDELNKKLHDFKITEYRLPSLKGIKSVKQIKKIEFLGNNLLGSTAIIIKTNKKKFFGSVVISQKVKNLYAIRIIKKNEIFTRNDFEITETYQTNKNYKNAISSYSEIKGKVSRITIKPYQKIYSHQFEEPNIVKKGDSVIIRAKKGNLTISMKGVAKQNGKLGKYIMVKSAFNNRVLRARVIAPQKVDILIGE